MMAFCERANDINLMIHEHLLRLIFTAARRKLCWKDFYSMLAQLLHKLSFIFSHTSSETVLLQRGGKRYKDKFARVNCLSEILCRFRQMFRNEYLFFSIYYSYLVTKPTLNSCSVLGITIRKMETILCLCSQRFVIDDLCSIVIRSLKLWRIWNVCLLWTWLWPGIVCSITSQNHYTDLGSINNPTINNEYICTWSSKEKINKHIIESGEAWNVKRSSKESQQDVRMIESILVAGAPHGISFINFSRKRMYHVD